MSLGDKIALGVFLGVLVTCVGSLVAMGLMSMNHYDEEDHDDWN